MSAAQSHDDAGRLTLAFMYTTAPDDMTQTNPVDEKNECCTVRRKRRVSPAVNEGIPDDSRTSTAPFGAIVAQRRASYWHMPQQKGAASDTSDALMASNGSLCPCTVVTRTHTVTYMAAQEGVRRKTARS